MKRLIFSGFACALALMPRAGAAAPAVGDVRNPAALFGQVMAACKANAQQAGVPNIVHVTPGTYLIPAKPGQNISAGWEFTGQNALHDCTIDLTGVTLVFQGIDGPNLEFAGCKNAVFRGATVYKQVPSFTQGTIVKKDTLDADHWYEDVQIDAGYLSDPALLKAAPTVHLFDPKITDKAGRPQWKAGVGGYSHAGQVLATATAGQIRLVYTAKAMETEPAAGDRVVLRGIGVFSFTVNNCTDMTFSNLTLENNGLYGIVEFGGVATKYLGCKITYGPPPPGATVPPIVATSADGLHSLYGNPGPDIENCVIEGTPDDCIAIHGAYGTIDQTLPGNVVVLGAKSFRNQQNFVPGDDMRIQGDTRGFYADARVLQAQPVAGGGWQYTLDRALDLQAGDEVANPARCGHGYKIIGCTIRRNRARGMLLKADDGLVEHNLVEDSTIAGIVVTPEDGGGEAGYAHNVVIRGNTIRHTGYAENGPWNSQAGGISVQGNGSIGNQNITVENNVFDRVLGANLIIRDTAGTAVRGNRFLHAHSADVQSGTQFGIDPSAIIDVLQSRAVTLTRNTTDGLGPFGKRLIAVAPDVTDIHGAETGLTLTSPH